MAGKESPGGPRQFPQWKGDSLSDHKIRRFLRRGTAVGARRSAKAARRAGKVSGETAANIPKNVYRKSSKKHPLATPVAALALVAAGTVGVVGAAASWADDRFDEWGMPDPIGAVDRTLDRGVDRVEDVINGALDLTVNQLPYIDKEFDLNGNTDDQAEKAEGSAENGETPAEPEFRPALNTEQEGHVNALIKPFFQSFAEGKQAPSVSYESTVEGKSGYEIDEEKHLINIKINTADHHNDVLTAQVLANTAALEYTDDALNGALKDADERAEESVNGLGDQTILDSNEQDNLSPTKRQFLDQGLDWESADETFKVITTARMMPEQLLAYIAAGDQSGYGSDGAAARLIVRTRLQALTPLVPPGQTLPDYLTALQFHPGIVALAA